jgi:hypothetical protein
MGETSKKTKTRQAAKIGSRVTVGAALAVILAQVLRGFGIEVPESVIAPVGAILSSIVHEIEGLINA